MISKYRPFWPILGVTSDRKIARQLRLLWGVEPVYIAELNDLDNTKDIVKKTVSQAFKMELIAENETAILVTNLFDVKSDSYILSILPANTFLNDIQW
jgi:pyruvate kinase